MKRFPSVKSLAKAPQDQVLTLWQGLGYYRRAKHLHMAAKEIDQVYGGKLPSKSIELKKLKGFGPYTSAAVASIAFGEPVACVDGNVIRVLSRLLCLKGNIQPMADELLDSSCPSDFNQAMMELGARICLPKNPKCSSCPVATTCQALRRGCVSEYPAKKAKTQVQEIYTHVFFLHHKKSNSFLARQRPAQGRWAGLWECPSLETESETFLAKDLTKLGMEKDYLWPLQGVSMFTHLLSHQKHHVQVYALEVSKSQCKKIPGQWISMNDQSQYAFSRLQQKAMMMAWDALAAPSLLPLAKPKSTQSKGFFS
ncbi:MAG: NUDIX domain-containing protein [Bdellovibrionota bacterium]